MGEELVDVRELARRYSTPVSWWYNMAESGAVPSFKLGKYRRFRLSEVEAWIERRRQDPAPR
jgi:excisionase family DNA binding protein